MATGRKSQNPALPSDTLVFVDFKRRHSVCQPPQPLSEGGGQLSYTITRDPCQDQDPSVFIMTDLKKR